MKTERRFIPKKQMVAPATVKVQLHPNMLRFANEVTRSVNEKRKENGVATINTATLLSAFVVEKLNVIAKENQPERVPEVKKTMESEIHDDLSC